MAITSIVISIYDTTLPAIVGQQILDFAEKGSIHWIFDGGDDKFLTMMPSRLEFDMEVSIEDSLNVLVYDYLFTGNETRYNVVMTDQDANIIWQGFLLPEEYVEPYEKATFFIHFTATDGIGRLKGNKLPDSFYRARQSVIKTLVNCLEKTGLQLDLWIDTAIRNNIASDYWETIFVDAQQWAEDEKPLNCYDILNNILEEIGGTLFQQENKWYIMAWNKRGTVDSFYRKYTFEGEYLGGGQEFYSLKYLSFYTAPSISIKPPFREVTVKENLPETIDLFPNKLITQPWTMDHDGQLAPPVQFWKTVGAGKCELREASNWDFKEWDDEEFEQDAVMGYTITEPSIPFVPSYPGTVDNYITLYRPVYIKGNQYIDFDFVWDFRIQNPTNSNLDVYINENQWYEITLNNTVIISNRHLFPGRDLFRWSSNGTKVFVDPYTILTATVKIRKFYLPESGFLNIKFFHPSTSISPPEVDFKFRQLSFTYRNDLVSFFKKRRVIDYTTTKELTLNNGGSVYNDVKTSFVFQPTIDTSEFTELPFTISTTHKGRANVSTSVFNTVILNNQSIYVQRENSDFLEYIYQWIYFGLLSFSVQPVFQDGYFLRANDKIFLRSGVIGSPQSDGRHQAREQWITTTNSNGIDRLGRVLANMYHNLYPTSIVTMEGRVKGLVQPKDVLQFELKKIMRNFIPVRIDITPNENESSVTLVEYKDEKVTNYGD